MPTRWVTRWPVSSSRLASWCQAPSRRSESRTEACSVVMPVPRFLGRSQAGERTIRNRRPDRVSLEADRGRTPSAAWSERSRLAVWRSPGTSPYSAKQTASRTLVLPAPVAPVSRNRPASESASKSTLDLVGERPERGDLEVVEPHQAPPAHEGVEVGVVAAGVAGVAEQARTRRRWPGRRAGRRRSRGRCRGRCGRCVRAAGARRGSGSVGLERRARGCAGTGARSRSIACSGRVSSVSVACTQDCSWRGERGVGQQVVERAA